MVRGRVGGSILGHELLLRELRPAHGFIAVLQSSQELGRQRDIRLRKSQQVEKINLGDCRKRDKVGMDLVIHGFPVLRYFRHFPPLGISEQHRRCLWADLSHA